MADFIKQIRFLFSFVILADKVMGRLFVVKTALANFLGSGDGEPSLFYLLYGAFCTGCGCNQSIHGPQST